MRKATCLISVVLIAGTAGVGFAKGPHDFGGRGGPSAEYVRPFSPMIGKGGMHGLGPGTHLKFLLSHPALAEKAGLTKEEISSLRTMMFEHRSEMIDLEARAERARLALEKAKTADKPDLKAVEKAIDEIHSIDAEIEKAKFRHQQAIRSIIGDERLEEIRSQAIKAVGEFRRERWGARHVRKGIGARRSPWWLDDVEDSVPDAPPEGPAQED